jgi:uncharacterized protein (TIGR03083 family)
MDHESHLQAIERASSAFATAAARAGLGAAVPSCPGWDVGELVRHLGRVQRFWAHVAANPGSTWEHVDAPEFPADEKLLDWFAEQSSTLLASLRALDPATERWTWSTDHTAGWIARRQAHEAAVHRWDAELAAGDPQPVDALLASDGIDEFLTWMLGPDETRPAGSVHLHCGDVEGEWTLHPIDGGGYELRREHAKGACALRGTANDLLLALWGRRPLSSVDVVGDAELAAAFVEWAGAD